MVQELKKAAQLHGSLLWKRVATDLEKPTRKRRVVNLYKIDKNSMENEIIVVPGKVLGDGVLSHKVTIAAWRFSESAMEKIKQSDCVALNILELVKKNPKGSNLKLIG